MRRIIASLDIGSHTIKLVVGEIVRGKLNILACVDTPSRGIKKGYIVNPESAIIAIKDAFDKCENMIGLPIKKVLLNVPTDNLECFVSSGSINITSEDNVITHEDVTKAMQKSIYKKFDNNKELVGVLPTKFILNDDEVVSNPIRCVAGKLTVNVVVAVVPKTNTENIIRVLDKMGIKVMDVCIGPLADFYEFKTPDKINEIGAVVNIGYSNTVVSIINKGIITSSEIIDLASSAIDKDIAYVFKTNKKDANYIKENLTCADIHMARPNENITIKDINGDDRQISEYDASAVAISRLKELAGLIKKQINLLTKKEISYIIITGGVTQMAYFDHFIDDNFKNLAIFESVKEVGARNNKYSSCVGAIKYYNSRLKLRNVEVSIFNLDEQEELGGIGKKVNISDNSLLGKIYGYFFDN